MQVQMVILLSADDSYGGSDVGCGDRNAEKVSCRGKRCPEEGAAEVIVVRRLGAALESQGALARDHPFAHGPYQS
jgi:hypothetical protein